MNIIERIDRAIAAVSLEPGCHRPVRCIYLGHDDMDEFRLAVNPHMVQMVDDGGGRTRLMEYQGHRVFDVHVPRHLNVVWHEASVEDMIDPRPMLEAERRRRERAAGRPCPRE